ncbi:TIGR00341 family protein [Acinetobacter tibetensis]|uniref:TIGR00341 family protein n=1 Tax=Acinetobacter tibetensis TaxID=2943497 RepID=A0AAE9LRY1_9GAMM|nr:TIGR00341 family protein [Acinetobacter tibetensis]USE83642.1 TIGR00341 family protein [Acinetobacter tibetensis]
MTDKKQTPTIIVDDKPEQQWFENLKEKLRYQQAVRENSRKIDHKQVRLNIQTDALPSKTFFIMNALAAIIAAYGLLSDSTAVVIGAMLIAMMLGPISGISLALIDSRWILFRTALQTLVLGMLMIYGIGFLLGILHPNISITNEILARTHPNSLDLMIALAGGAAGAFASVSPRLSVAVVGVAVATALVPPLVASGILLSRAEFRLSANAFLLTFTNIIAIQVSSAMVLWIAGFRRGSNEEVSSKYLEFIKRNRVSLVILFILAIYLSFNLFYTVHNELYKSKITDQLSQTLNNETNIIDTVEFDPQPNFTLARVFIRGVTLPSTQQINELNRTLNTDQNGHPTYVQIRFIPIQILQTQPTKIVPLNPIATEQPTIKTLTQQDPS